MKHITILVPEGQNNLSSIVGSYKMLNKANEYWESTGKRTPYKIELAGISRAVSFHEGIFTVKPHTQISSIIKTNLIIIPSLNHNYNLAVKENKEIIDWIKDKYNGGAELASICTGAFLLASTGLLNGKSCSTHWSVSSKFRSTFENIDLQPDKLITDENGIYTNGGAYSFLNLIIYLIEKYYDRQTALYCAKVFQIDIDRKSQSSFAIFAGQKQHGDDLIEKVQLYIEKNIDEKISFSELSAKFAVGRRNFDRRFIKATGNTPVEYAQRVKIEAAKKTLENSRKTINEIMYEVGYNDVKAFREVFRKITGLSPLEYKTRYNKEAQVN